MTEGDSIGGTAARPAPGTPHETRVDLAAVLEELSSVGAFEILDFTTGVSHLTPGAMRVLGLRPGIDDDQVVYRRYIHPDDLDAAFAEIRTAVEGRGEGTSDHRLVRPDGEVRHVSNRFRCLTGPGDEVRVVGVVVDVTEVRRARDRRDYAEESLRRGFDDAPAGLSVTDDGVRVLRVNPALCRILGRRADEIVGRVALPFFHPDDLAELQRSREALARGDVATYEGDIRLLRPDGEVRWTRRTVSVVRDPDGRAVFLSQYLDRTDAHRAVERLADLASRDPATGLANRDTVTAGLADLLAAGRPLGCVVLGVDEVRVITDGLGHGVGEDVVGQLAHRLEAVARPGDLLARPAPDELVLVRPGVAPDGARQLGRDALAAVAGPVLAGGRTVPVGVSAGVSTTTGEVTDGVSAEVVLQQAGSALTRARRVGRSQVEVFDAALLRALRRRLETGTELRAALERDELTAHHQPVVDLASGRAVGVEALLRWEHPVRGTVLPGEIIDVAEQTGLVVPIGARVLTEALTAVARWRAEVPGAAGLWVAVNLSARQLADPELPDLVRDTLAATGLPAEALHLEMTESVLLDGVLGGEEVLHALRATGVELVVDDFGTGYSSLSYLARLPVSTLKLDRSFVAGLRTPGAPEHGIVTAVATLARTLHLASVAEGVEDAVQLAGVRAAGMTLGQGFLWARPAAAADAEEWLRANLAAAPVPTR